MLHDQISIPACFSSSEKHLDDPAVVTRPGQSVFMSIYHTKITGKCRFITVTWCKNAKVHGLSVAIEGPEGESQYICKVELKPLCFWRKQGSKHFVMEGKSVEIYWDLKAAKFRNETEPGSDYYVAVVCDEEVVLILGDMKKDCYRKTRCRPSLIDPILVSRREHVFGKKKFISKGKFHEKGRLHEISIECRNKGMEPEMEIRIDGMLFIHVKHLQWKFRGNECIHLKRVRLEVYWDVHDWLFSPGLSHGLFIFRPILLSSPSISSSSSSSPFSSTWQSMSSQTGSSSSSSEGFNSNGSSEFSLLLYAWKME